MMLGGGEEIGECVKEFQSVMCLVFVELRQCNAISAKMNKREPPSRSRNKMESKRKGDISFDITWAGRYERQMDKMASKCCELCS